MNNIEDKINILGSGSDHAPFAFYAGVPSLDFHFDIDKQKYPESSGGYPTYHTGYETFFLMDHLLDPGFKLHKTCSQLSLHIILQLAESTILPFQPLDIVKELVKAFDKMEKENVTKTLRDNGAGAAFDLMKKSFNGLKLTVVRWTEKRNNMETTDALMDPKR